MRKEVKRGHQAGIEEFNNNIMYVAPSIRNPLTEGIQLETNEGKQVETPMTEREQLETNEGKQVETPMTDGKQQETKIPQPTKREQSHLESPLEELQINTMVQIQEIHNQKPMDSINMQEVGIDLRFDTDHFAQSELVANNIGKRKIRDFLMTGEKRRRLLCSNNKH